MADYSISISAPNSSTNDKRVVHQLDDLQINHNHTGLSDWSAVIPYDVTIEGRLLDGVWIYHGSDVIFNGRFESIESQDADGTSKLSGRGPIIGLDHAQERFEGSYSHVTAHDALESYITNQTTFGLEKFVQADEGQLSNSVRSSTTYTMAERYDPSTQAEVFANANGEIEAYRTAFTTDASNNDTRVGGTAITNDDYALDSAIRFEAQGDALEVNTPFGYTLANKADYNCYVRAQSSDDFGGTLRLIVDGTIISEVDFSNRASGNHEWIDMRNDSAATSVNPLPDANPGTTRIEQPEALGGGTIDIDVIAPLDDSHSYVFPESLNDDNVYDGPEWHGEVELVGDGQNWAEPSQDVELYHELTVARDDWKYGVEEASTGNRHVVRIDADEPLSTPSATFTMGQTEDYVHSIMYVRGVYADTMAESGETSAPALAKTANVGADTAAFAFISEQDYSGTVLDVLAQLCADAGYRWTVTQWYEGGSSDIQAFPIGHRITEPNWTITDASRKLDYTGYANVVTVQGAATYPDNTGTKTYYEGTARHQDEIDAVGREIADTIRDASLTSDAECRRKARTILQERVQNREQSGELTVTPTRDVQPGFTYPVSVWSDAFVGGGRQGNDALNYEGAERGGSERVEWGIGTEPDDFVFKLLLHARLTEMNEPRYLLSCKAESDTLVLYPDGHLEYTHPNYNAEGVQLTSAADAVPGGRAVEVGIESDSTNGYIGLFVDGTAVAEKSVSTANTEFQSANLGTHSHDAPRHNSGTVLNFTLDEGHVRDSDNFVYDYSELGTNNGTVVDQDGDGSAEWTHVDGAHREGLKVTGQDEINVTDDSSLDMGTSDWTISFWLDAAANANTGLTIIDKGGGGATQAGYNVNLTSSSFLQFEWADGVSQQQLGFDFSSYENTLTHVAFEIDRDGDIVAYANGAEQARNAADFSGVTITNTLDLVVFDSVDTIAMDEVRIYSRTITSSELDFLSSPKPPYTFHGGLDNFRYWQNPSSSYGNLDAGTTTPYIWYQLDDPDDETVAIDSGTLGSNGTIVGPNYEAVRSELQEVGYELSMSGDLSLKFDISSTLGVQLKSIDTDIQRAMRGAQLR